MTATINTLSDYLKTRSAAICKDNHCTEDAHNCDSFAYINYDNQLLDICMADFFQGYNKAYAAIPLPWNGTQEELEREVADQCADCQ